MLNNKLQEAVDRLLEAVRESRRPTSPRREATKGVKKNENTPKKDLVHGPKPYTQHPTSKEEDEKC